MVHSHNTVYYVHTSHLYVWNVVCETNCLSPSIMQVIEMLILFRSLKKITATNNGNQFVISKDDL